MTIQGGAGTRVVLFHGHPFLVTPLRNVKNRRSRSPIVVLSVVALRRSFSCASWKSAIVRAGYNFASVVVVAAVLSFP
jgi:hypothetical protein